LNSAQSVVQGGGDALTLSDSGGSAATLIDTDGSADTVNGANSLLYLNGSQASVIGNFATLVMTGGAATVLADSDSFVFQAAFGQDTISGFNSTDTIQLPAADFASWNALQSDMTQSGSNTLITFDANDVITLVGVTAANLNQAEFSFK
jgi:serralysin